MDMQDAKDTLKKHWPIAVGVVGGILLIWWYRSRQSGGSYDSYASLLAQQAAAGSANAQYGLQVRQLELQAAAQERQANIAAMEAQGAVAGQLASGFSEIVGAINAPTVAAINAGAAENIATIQSSVAAAIGGFETQASIAHATATAAQGYAYGIASQTQSIVNALGAYGSSLATINETAKPTIQYQNPDNFGNLMETVGKGVAAYYTGGASLALG